MAEQPSIAGAAQALSDRQKKLDAAEAAAEGRPVAPALSPTRISTGPDLTPSAPRDDTFTDMLAGLDRLMRFLGLREKLDQERPKQKTNGGNGSQP